MVTIDRLRLAPVQVLCVHRQERINHLAGRLQEVIKVVLLGLAVIIRAEAIAQAVTLADVHRHHLLVHRHRSVRLHQVVAAEAVLEVLRTDAVNY